MMANAANRKRQLLRLIAFSGFVLRALIPVGYMPAPLADGLPFVLCPGGNLAIGRFLDWRDPDASSHYHAPATADGSSDQWEHCLFAGSASVAMLSASLAATSFPLFADDPEFAIGGFVIATRWTRHQVRAPPPQLA